MDPAEDWLFIQRQRHNTNMRSLHASNWADAQSEYPPEQPPPGYGWNNDFRQNQQYVGQWQQGDWHSMQGQRFHDQMREAGYRGYPAYHDGVRRPGWMQWAEPWR
ncbi:unnamed protein product [Zymoseptoria tritici ST99CH_1A5]|uniref:Uncharacterized protein n=1 Tax=Zymoseptoria tritici ST99CH_1A5 TaxID=1276529 RepID=A0A1Y6LPQ7_ZYMTR|nr:unnamed protein product [Zymoseptoria tritici ST99CH_1A5]